MPCVCSVLCVPTWLFSLILCLKVWNSEKIEKCCWSVWPHDQNPVGRVRCMLCILRRGSGEFYEFGSELFPVFLALCSGACALHALLVSIFFFFGESFSRS